MLNDVGVPPDPNAPIPNEPTNAGSARVRARLEPSHPHAADRAHSLERTSDRPATGMIYETPEDRGGIDSTTLSIVVVAGVAIALLIVAYLFFRRL